MSDLIFTSHFTIRSSEIDSEKYIHPHCLLQLMQEASLQHTIQRKLSFWDMHQANTTWVLLHISVQYVNMPMLNDEIVVETYPTEVNGFFTYRDYVAKDKHGVICAQASSKWVLIDIDKRKPMRIPQHIQSLIPTHVQPFKTQFNPIEKSTIEATQKQIKVHYYHLDWNGHVNNIKLYEYLLQSFDHIFLQTHYLHFIDIQFKGEVLVDEEIVVTIAQKESLQFYHSILKKVDQKLVTEAISIWSPK